MTETIVLYGRDAGRLVEPTPALLRLVRVAGAQSEPIYLMPSGRGRTAVFTYDGTRHRRWGAVNAGTVTVAGEFGFLRRDPSVFEPPGLPRQRLDCGHAEAWTVTTAGRNWAVSR